MIFAGGHILVTELRAMALNGLFSADVLRPLNLVPLTDFTYKYHLANNEGSRFNHPCHFLAVFLRLSNVNGVVKLAHDHKCIRDAQPIKLTVACQQYVTRAFRPPTRQQILTNKRNKHRQITASILQPRILTPSVL